MDTGSDLQTDRVVEKSQSCRGQGPRYYLCRGIRYTLTSH